jgi:hypothetical protein
MVLRKLVAVWYLAGRLYARPKEAIMKAKILGFAILILLADSIASAIPPVYSSVSSYSNVVSLQGQSFFIVHETDRSKEDGFEFKEFSSYLKKSLISRGMSASKDLDSADVIVFFGYGIGEPKTENVEYSIPLFGQTGVASANTTGAIIGRSVIATTTFTPSFGITGVVQQSGTITTFDRWVRIVAVDAASAKLGAKNAEKWRVDVKSSGYSGDLRAIMPFMLFSAKDYIGVNSMKAVDVKVKEKSKPFRLFINNLLSK